MAHPVPVPQPARRTIVIAAGAAAITGPAWLLRAFFGDDLAEAPAESGVLAEAPAEPGVKIAPVVDIPHVPDGVDDLMAAYRRASRRQVPLVVIVIPEDDMLRWQWAMLVGGYLNYGTGADLAALARTELVCATKRDLSALVDVAGEPLLVRVDPQRPRSSLRVTGARPQIRMADRWTDEGALFEENLAATDAAFAELLGEAQAAPEAVALAKSHWVEGQVPGSRWARSHGCGVSIEGGRESSGLACGMGHVPKKGERFLYFYTFPDRDAW
jgi:hypothetical protein